MCCKAPHCNTFLSVVTKANLQGKAKKHSLEEKLFYAFPAAKLNNISRGSDVFILEFLPYRDDRHYLSAFKRVLQTFSPNTNTTFDLILPSLSTMFLPYYPKKY